MSAQIPLFALPPRQGPSKAERLAAFVAEHGILTHYASHARTDRHMALLPIPEHRGRDIGEIMAEWARRYDETDRVVTARSRLAAVRELARLNGIPCDL
jgi:hypothetical protein